MTVILFQMAYSLVASSLFDSVVVIYPVALVCTAFLYYYYDPAPYLPPPDSSASAKLLQHSLCPSPSHLMPSRRSCFQTIIPVTKQVIILRKIRFYLRH